MKKQYNLLDFFYSHTFSIILIISTTTSILSDSNPILLNTYENIINIIIKKSLNKLIFIRKLALMKEERY